MALFVKIELSFQLMSINMGNGASFLSWAVGFVFLIMLYKGGKSLYVKCWESETECETENDLVMSKEDETKEFAAHETVCDEFLNFRKAKVNTDRIHIKGFC